MDFCNTVEEHELDDRELLQQEVDLVFADQLFIVQSYESVDMRGLVSLVQILW